MDILGEAGRGSAKVRVESAESVGGISQSGGGINQPEEISAKVEVESAKTRKISAKVKEESAKLRKYQPK
ncbi:hypothetical protein M1D49_02470 [Bacillus sp. PK3-056]|uniref:hypothetical protein n=1 Tax=Niallia circulans TaxID=1397 RepID=UPI000F45AA71|nr:hypothetical protein [Niallia circulans]AYV73307.1 hypothetical protein C2H98_18075 [Niallia circulans]